MQNVKKDLSLGPLKKARSTDLQISLARTELLIIINQNKQKHPLHWMGVVG